MSSRVSMASSLLCCLLIFVISHSSIVDAEIKGFTVDIIHRHSKLSPFYNQSAKSEKSSRDAVNANYLSRFRDEKLETLNRPNGFGDYIMKIYIGTPPVEMYAIADTGSDLVWLQCAPCPQCYQQDIPLFEPTQSYTYWPLSCYSRACHALQPPQLFGCGSFLNECVYHYAYGDLTSYTNGVLSTETISVSCSANSVNGILQLTSFPNFVFGCGHQNEGGSLNRHGAGIVGLSRGPLSLISQLGIQKISYCLPPPSSNSSGKIAFGEDAVMHGSNNNLSVSTPLLRRPGEEGMFYYVNLEGVSVGGTRIAHNQTNTTYGNILLDSGSQLTYLEPGFRNSVEAAVKKAITLTPLQSSHYKMFSLCYMEIPEIEVVFHFTNANVTLKPLNLFVPDGDRFCFMMVPAADGIERNIYGNTAQMNFQVGYDMENNLISFAPTDCA